MGVGHYKRNSPPNYQRVDSNKVVLKSQKSRSKMVDHHDEEDENPMERITELIRKSIPSGKADELKAFLKRDGNKARLSGRWGNIIISVFVNRRQNEVEQFILFVVELMEAECIKSGGHFVKENVAFLAANCDDSAGDCPNFCQYVGTLMAKLCGRGLIAVSALDELHHCYFRDVGSEYAAEGHTKCRRFSQILVSMMECLSADQNNKALQEVARRIALRIDRSHIDRAVFAKKGKESLYKMVVAD